MTREEAAAACPDGYEATQFWRREYNATVRCIEERGVILGRVPNYWKEESNETVRTD